jgi:hypothetical protein
MVLTCPSALRDLIICKRAWLVLFPNAPIPNFRETVEKDLTYYYCETPSGHKLIIRLTGADGRVARCACKEFDVPNNTRVIKIPCGRPAREVSHTNVST